MKLPSSASEAHSKSKSPSPTGGEPAAAAASVINNPEVAVGEAGQPNITDEEKEMMIQTSSFTLDGKPFLESVFSALDSSENDYLTLYALCLLYAMQQNSGK